MTGMTNKSVVERLVEGERLFLPGASHYGATDPSPGSGMVAGLYGKVRRRGKYMHARLVDGGVELWADDTPALGTRERPKHTFERRG